jgi:hypothetical protein
MAYEAMNHAGFLDKNMIVILNDNQQVGSSFCSAALSVSPSQNLVLSRPGRCTAVADAHSSLAAFAMIASVLNNLCQPVACRYQHETEYFYKHNVTPHAHPILSPLFLHEASILPVGLTANPVQ